jgi:hypothetical protein
MSSKFCGANSQARDLPGNVDLKCSICYRSRKVVNDDAYNGDGAEHLHMGIRLSDEETARARDGLAWLRGYRHNSQGIPCTNNCEADFAAASDVISILGGETKISGDWNNDGIDAVWTFDKGEWQVPAGDGGVSFGFGIPGDLPIVGDWDGDDEDDFGVLRPAIGR